MRHPVDISRDILNPALDISVLLGEEQEQKKQKENGRYDRQGCVDVEERTSRKDHTI